MADPYKVWRSTLDERTTLICLEAHGLVVAPDERFETLSGRLDGPPAHWRCRSVVDLDVLTLSKQVTRPNVEGKRFVKNERTASVPILKAEVKRLGQAGYARKREQGGGPS